MALSVRACKRRRLSPYFSTTAGDVLRFQIPWVSVKRFVGVAAQEELRFTKEEENADNKRRILSGKTSTVETPERGVPDYLRKDLRILIVGYNPGVQSAAKGWSLSACRELWEC